MFGIAECGVLTALARAETFGVIAIAQRSIRRHMRYLRQMGLTERMSGERPLNMSVAETASGEGTLAKMIEVGRILKEEDGAGAIVIGCAGMARHRRSLEQALGVTTKHQPHARRLLARAGERIATADKSFVGFELRRPNRRGGTWTLVARRRLTR